ncbi:hypothetical protein BJV74DRAFT_168204 [Russula compacta]|nr:hypothetical protein BJV74DRAFT_168204 [Russula compacta]
MSNHPRSLSDLPHVYDTLHLSNSGITQIFGVFRFLGTLHVHLEFRSSLPQVETCCYPPPLTRIVLPAVTTLHFSGISEDLVSKIDVPLLGNVDIINSFSTFRISSGSQVARKSSGHCIGPLRGFPRKRDFFLRCGWLKAYPQSEMVDHFRLGISCSEPEWQPSSFAQAVTRQLLGRPVSFHHTERGILVGEWVGRSIIDVCFPLSISLPPLVIYLPVILPCTRPAPEA